MFWRFVIGVMVLVSMIDVINAQTTSHACQVITFSVKISAPKVTASLDTTSPAGTGIAMNVQSGIDNVVTTSKVSSTIENLSTGIESSDRKKNQQISENTTPVNRTLVFTVSE